MSGRLCPLISNATNLTPCHSGCVFYESNKCLLRMALVKYVTSKEK